MRDGVDPWRTGDLVYLEREINYYTGPSGYQACTAGVRGNEPMPRRVAWTASLFFRPGPPYSGVLRDHVAQIDPAGLVTDCDGAEIVTMPTEESLGRFVEWCKQHVRWGEK